MEDWLTFEQCLALDYNRNMVVTAGPGAGKTRVLTERFCHLFLTNDDLEIEEILALTFTEKAAEEMKARIYLKFIQMLNRLGCRDEGHTNLRARIRHGLDKFSKNRIGTIHSFCAYLLRQYPVEAGVDPGFIIVQGFSRREMIMNAIGKAVSSMSRKKPDDFTRLMGVFGTKENLMEAVKNTMEHPVVFNRVLETRGFLFGGEEWKDEVFKEYCRHIRDNQVIPYYQGLKELKKGRGQHEEVMKIFSDWYGKRDLPEKNFGIPELFGGIRELCEKRPKGSSRLAVWHGAREISYINMAERFFPDLFYCFNPDDIFLQELDRYLMLAKEAFEYYQQEKDMINALDFADLEAGSLRLLRELYQSPNRYLLQRILDRFRYVMVDEFQDTNRCQWEIISLLVSGGESKSAEPVLADDKLFVVGDKRQAIYRFRGADVTVFDRVTEAIRSSNSNNNRPLFFQEEDVSEKILRAVPEFKVKIREYGENLGRFSMEETSRIFRGDIRMGLNFRSCPGLIEFFNRTFSNIFGNKGACDTREYECKHMPIKEGSVPGRVKGRGSVAFHLIPEGGKSTREYSKQEKEASLVAEIINNMLGKNGKDNPEYKLYGDIRHKVERGEPAIGILFFAYTHINTFESIFREAGLPFAVNRGKGFFRCQEVMELVQLLRYLADERQSISFLAVLRGSIFGLTDPEIFELFEQGGDVFKSVLGSPKGYIREIGKQIRTWRLLKDRLSIRELIRTVVRERGLVGTLSSHPDRVQKLANVEKLIDMARQFELEVNGFLPEFVSYCMKSAEEADGEGEALAVLPRGVPVHLMTVHAAKGLEFPMVIIPELDRPLPRGPAAGKPMPLLFDYDSRPREYSEPEGLIPAFDVEYPARDHRKTSGPLTFFLKHRNGLEDTAENRRVFYVACTRAMDHLILTGHISVAEDKVQKKGLTTNDYREAASIMELLDDTWGIRSNFSPEKIGLHPGKDEFPRIVWSEPVSKEYTGVSSREADLTPDDFGRKDENILAGDYTGKIIISSPCHLSPTALALYKKCPLKFYYRYQLKIPEDSIHPAFAGEQGHLAEGEEEGTAEYRITGSIVHAYLERHEFGSELEEELLESLFATFLGRNTEAMISGGLDIDRIKMRSKKLLLKVTGDKYLLKMLAGVPRYSEMPFLLNGNGYILRGRIDMLFGEKGGNEWSLLDWKTGEPGDRSPHDFAAEQYYDLQLACYKWAVESVKNRKVKNTYIYMASAGKLLRIEPRQEPEMEIRGVISFLDGYKQQPEEKSRVIREIKRKQGECLRCGYLEQGLCV